MDCESLIKPPTTKVLKSGRVKLSSGEEVGEHVTDKREEIIIIMKGKATIVEEGREFVVEEKNIHFIREGTTHNVKNLSDGDVEYVYVVSLFE